jgi:hypothetical protein
MRRNVSIERAMLMRFWDPPYKIPVNIISPLSVVRLKRQLHWATEWEPGDTFRIGYYSPLNGPNEVRVVDAAGNYHWAWTQKSLLEDFEVVEFGKESDIFGHHREQIQPLP